MTDETIRLVLHIVLIAALAWLLVALVQTFWEHWKNRSGGGS